MLGWIQRCLLALALAGCKVPIACTSPCSGDFDVASADDLGAVAGCTEVGGSLVVRDPQLRDLSALTCLESVGGDFSLGGTLEYPLQSEHPPQALGPVRLASLAGLDRLESVGGALRIGGELVNGMAVREDLDAGPVRLVSLDGAPNLRSAGSLAIGTSVQFDVEPENLNDEIPLGDLSGLDGLAVAGDVEISLHGVPVDLPALTLAPNVNVRVIGAGITSVSAPIWPTSLATLSIRDTSVTSLDGLDAITSVESLVLVGNAELTDYSGLGAAEAMYVLLENVGVGVGALGLTSADDLTVRGDTTPLANLAEVSTFTLAPGLSGTSRLDGLGSLATVGDATLLVFGDTDLSDLGALRQVGSLQLSGDLSSLSGLGEGLSIRSLSIVRTALVDFRGLPVGADPDQLSVWENAELSSLSGLEDVVPDDAMFRDNPKLAQCAVDAWRAERGFPFDEWIAYGNASGNAISCTCDADGTVTCPDPRCTNTMAGSYSIGTVAEAEAFADITCAEMLYVFGGPVDLTLPNLVSVETIVGASSTLRTLSLPALERVGKLTFGTHATNGTSAPLEAISLPALTSAYDIGIYGPPRLVSFEAPLLTTVVDLEIDCAYDTGPTTPLAVLDLGNLSSARDLRIVGCAELPACAVAADLAAADLGAVELSGLDEACTCDTAGEPLPGTCDGG